MGEKTVVFHRKMVFLAIAGSRQEIRKLKNIQNGFG